ncbi:MAG: hypothetical protein P9L99_14890 [Candidatus Lernaella stagnicola]|nr:hypothetical protein [Candidatus Lernaella stagnicola]
MNGNGRASWPSSWRWMLPGTVSSAMTINGSQDDLLGDSIFNFLMDRKSCEVSYEYGRRTNETARKSEMKKLFQHRGKR